MVQKFTNHPLYKYTGRGVPGGTPDDWPNDDNPGLVCYMNHLAQKGLRVFQVVIADDSMWYDVITVEDIDNGKET